MVWWLVKRVQVKEEGCEQHPKKKGIVVYAIGGADCWILFGAEGDSSACTGRDVRCGILSGGCLRDTGRRVRRGMRVGVREEVLREGVRVERGWTVSGVNLQRLPELNGS
jgi:hypothetical protein